MQEKRKEIRKQQTKGKQTPAKPRSKATRTQTQERTRCTASRDNVKVKPAPQGQRQASYVKQEATDTFTPEFRPCALTGPDGQTRPGWEMIVGDMVFGKADAKETLLAYYSRLHDPLPSGHWKERAWQPAKKRVGSRQSADGPQAGHEETDLDFEPDTEPAW